MAGAVSRKTSYVGIQEQVGDFQPPWPRDSLAPMDARTSTAEDDAARQRRLALAQQAFRDFFAECFWSSDPGHRVEERDLPWIIRNLREHGGHRGYRIVAELCR